MWFTLALTGALSNALYFLLIKKTIADVDNRLVAAIANLTAGLILGLISISSFQPSFSHIFLIYSTISSIIAIITTVLYIKALEISDLSLCIPMLAFTPLFLLLTSSIMLNETPSPEGIIGIICIVVGVYILNYNGENFSPLAPIKQMTKDRGVQYMLIVAFLFSIAVNFDKLLVQESNPAISSVIILLVLGIFFLFYYFYDRNETNKIPISSVSLTIIAGVVLAIEAISINYAYLETLVPYVISVKRMSILFSIIFGYIFFKERFISIRLTGGIIMTIGATFIFISN